MHALEGCERALLEAWVCKSRSVTLSYADHRARAPPPTWTITKLHSMSNLWAPLSNFMPLGALCSGAQDGRDRLPSVVVGLRRGCCGRLAICHPA